MKSGAARVLTCIAVLLAVSAGTAAAGAHLVWGSEDDAVMLLRPRQAAEGPDGNIYVLDHGDSTIKVYGPDGAFLRKLAGEGEGPGELQRADGSTFGFLPDDRLFITEFYGGHRWITILGLDGDLVRVVSPDLDSVFGIQAAAPLDGGGFLVQFSFDTQPRRDGDHYLYDVPQAVVAMDSLGGLGAEIVRTESTRLISYTPNGGTTNLPYTPAFAWTVGPDGTIIWSDGLSPELRVYDRDGRPVRTIASGLPEPEKVTGDEIRAWQKQRADFMSDRNPDWWNRFGRVVEEYDESLYDKPVLSRLATTPAGNLLAEGRWDEDREGVAYWLLDGDGRILKTAAAPVGNLVLSPHYLLFLSQGEDGETLVHALERPADEASALALLENEMGTSP